MTANDHDVPRMAIDRAAAAARSMQQILDLSGEKLEDCANIAEVKPSQWFEADFRHEQAQRPVNGLRELSMRVDTLTPRFPEPKIEYPPLSPLLRTAIAAMQSFMVTAKRFEHPRMAKPEEYAELAAASFNIAEAMLREAASREPHLIMVPPCQEESESK